MFDDPFRVRREFVERPEDLKRREWLPGRGEGLCSEGAGGCTFWRHEGSTDQQQAVQGSPC